MKTIAAIFSNVQTDTNDIDGKRIMLAEYVDYAQRVLDDLCFELNVWVKYKTYTPNPSTNPLVTPNNVLIIDSSDNAVNLLRVVRNGREAREYSRQAVGSQGAGNYAFANNSVSLNNADFYSYKDKDENMFLVFMVPFALDESIYIEFLSGRPYNFIKWTQNTSIPDFLCDVVEYGIKMRIFERLFNSGVDTMLSRFQNSERMYLKSLGKARAYTKNFHDERSVVQRQPLKWLPETNRGIY
jgi:hypothetical protein